MPLTMADFLGKTVVVTLKSGRTVQGVVGAVVTNSAVPQLTINNALFKDSGHVFQSWNLPGNEIADLAFVTTDIRAPNATAPVTTAVASPPPNRPHDPAIVSYAKPKDTTPIEKISSKPAVPIESKPVQAHGSRPLHTELSKVDDAARLKGPFLATLEVQTRGQAPQKVSYSGKLKENLSTQPQIQPQYQILRREPKPKLDVATVALPQGDGELVTAVKVKTVKPTDGIESSPRRARKAKNNGSQGRDLVAGNPSFKGKGWRQDPMLTEVHSAVDTGSTQIKKRSKLKKHRPRPDDLTGWATEDATDIQELGEFDFEANLANFDKASVFAQLKQEDDVPEEERLVSHNKLKVRARPGTFGGTKLHPTENVLDIPSPAFLTNSRRGSARQRSPSSGSSSEAANVSVRGGSKNSGHLKQRRFPTRTSTVNLTKVERSNTDPVLSARLESSIPSLKRPSQPTSSTSNGHFPRLTPSESEGVANDHMNGNAGAVNFYLEDTKSICPVITPGGMTALEDLARSEHRYKHHIINENAGRTLAEIIVSDVLSDKVGLSKSPTAIFLVGNHRAGARALVAARHLMSRGFSPVCCVLGLDRPGSQLDHEADKQITMIRQAASAVVANWREVQKYLMVNEEQGRFADVWIDAIVAPGHSYDTLVPEDQNAVREMVSWANRRPTSLGPRAIYSIDVPCGINASTGESTVTGRNSRIQLRSTNIVCMGAPRSGLLNALRNAWAMFKSDTANGMQSAAQIEALLACTVHVIDIGINEVWKAFGQQLGLATGSGVDFGLKWYMALRLDQENNDDETWETE